MTKKIYISYFIIIISLILIIIGFTILRMNFFKNKPKKENTIIESKNIDFEKDLYAKALLYVAEKYHYTTNKYNINIEQKDKKYIIEIKSFEGILIDNVVVDSITLKKWKPDVPISETIEEQKNMTS